LLVNVIHMFVHVFPTIFQFDKKELLNVTEE
jgi:hypothetical protein